MRSNVLKEMKQAIELYANPKKLKDMSHSEIQSYTVPFWNTLRALLNAKFNHVAIKDNYGIEWKVSEYDLPSDSVISKAVSIGQVFMYGNVNLPSLEVLTRKEVVTEESSEALYVSPDIFKLVFERYAEALGIDNITFERVSKKDILLSELEAIMVYPDDDNPDYALYANTGMSQGIDKRVSLILGLQNPVISQYMMTSSVTIVVNDYVEVLFGRKA